MADLLPGRRDPWTEPPMGLLAELTHRCPLQCPYCSNPLELERVGGELDRSEWCRVLDEAAELGVLQVHLSGGEPTVRTDLEAIVAHARELGLYTNLITAGVLLDERRIASLRAAGLEHVQLSLQAAEPEVADRVGAYRNGHAKKLVVARAIRAAGLPLTVNAVVHRQNLDQLQAMVDLALELGAHRLEVAHVQYYGWALRNRAALMPTREQLDAATEIVDRSRRELRGRLAIDYVIPDYWAKRPKPCMGGWGSTILNVTPSGKVMPCHAAASIPGLEFTSVRERPLRWIWQREPRLPALSRHRLAAGPLPLLCPQGGRLRRLPLPGDGADRRRHGDRPRLRAVAAARGDVHRRPRRVGGRAAALRLSPPAPRRSGRDACAPGAGDRGVLSLSRWRRCRPAAGPGCCSSRS